MAHNPPRLRKAELEILFDALYAYDDDTNMLLALTSGTRARNRLQKTSNKIYAAVNRLNMIACYYDRLTEKRMKLKGQIK